MMGDKKLEWNKNEDGLLGKSDELLERWKGPEAVQLRKKYANFKIR